MINNDKGFSLVQVLISSGLLGAAALVGIKMMSNQEKLAKSTNQKYEIAYIHEEIWRTLQDMNNCESTFAGSSIKESNIQKIDSIKKQFNTKNGISQKSLYRTFSSSNILYGVNNLKVDSYAIFEKNNSEEPIFNLSITFDKGKNSFGTRFTKRVVPIVFSTQNNKITNCNALPLAESEEEVMADTSDNDVLAIKKNLSIDRVPAKDATLALSGELYFVKGSLRPNCTPENRGMISFDYTSEDLLFCNGSAQWIPWGIDIIDWSQGIKVELQTSKNSAKVLGEYKLCALQRVQDIKHTHCQLGPQKVDLINHFVWTMKPSKDDIGSCTFLCFR